MAFNVRGEVQACSDAEGPCFCKELKSSKYSYLKTILMFSQIHRILEKLQCICLLGLLGYKIIGKYKQDFCM